MWIDKSASRGTNSSVGGATLFLVLSIHSLLAGMALGVEAHPAQAIAILVAIVAHKGSAAFALGLRSTDSHYWRRMITFALMTPIGVVLGTAITLLLQSQSEQRFEAVFDAIAAGTFLYVALSEILPGELEDNEHVHRAMISTVAGLLLMAVLALYT
jgi:zinc transporter 1/2/3